VAVKPRRTRHEIELAILKAVLEPLKPTTLMYAVNLSWRALNEYLIPLLRAGWIERIPNPDKDTLRQSPELLKITNKGVEILQLPEAKRISILKRTERRLQQILGRGDQSAAGAF
jgi:predicted transcriptional regulator